MNETATYNGNRLGTSLKSQDVSYLLVRRVIAASLVSIGRLCHVKKINEHNHNLFDWAIRCIVYVVECNE